MMKRVLGALAVAGLLVLLGAAVLGLAVGDDAAFRRHFALALFAAVLTLLIHVVVFTYFSVTARMISQAVLIGDLDRAALASVRALKRRIAVCVGAAALSIVVVVSFGALIESDYSWHWWHLGAAAAAIGVNAWAYFVEYDCVFRNGRLIEDVFAAYDAKRRQIRNPTTDH